MSATGTETDDPLKDLSKAHQNNNGWQIHQLGNLTAPPSEGGTRWGFGGGGEPEKTLTAAAFGLRCGDEFEEAAELCVQECAIGGQTGRRPLPPPHGAVNI